MKKQARNSTPKPRTHTPTPEKRKLVHDLAAMGTRHEDICDLLDIGSINTLKNHYSEELKKGRVTATAKVAQALYKKAIEGDTACMIFWMKTQGGWRETDRMNVNVRQEISGPDGGPIPVIGNYIISPEKAKDMTEWELLANPPKSLEDE